MSNVRPIVRGISVILRQLQSTRIASSLSGNLALLEASLRVAYAGRPYFIVGIDREAFHESGPGFKAPPDRTRPVCAHSRRHVRFRRFALTSCGHPRSTPTLDW